MFEYSVLPGIEGLRIEKIFFSPFAECRKQLADLALISEIKYIMERDGKNNNDPY